MDHIDFNCVFCAIAAQRAPAAVVYEDEGALAFMDIHPITEGHVLVIPKKHNRNLFDLDDDSSVAVLRVARTVARGLRGALNADGMNLFQSSERAGGQEVFHFHFHLIPRFEADGVMAREGGGRTMRWRPRGSPSRVELDVLAAKIKAAIGDQNGRR